MIEVADSSLADDLGAKLEQYARAGIPRYWVVDVVGRTLRDYHEFDWIPDAVIVETGSMVCEAFDLNGRGVEKGL